MSKQVHNPEPEVFEPVILDEPGGTPVDEATSRKQAIASLRKIWGERRSIARIALFAMVISTLAAFLIPSKYESTARLMPPDDRSGSLAMLAAVSNRAPGLGALAGDLLGANTKGAVFVGILRSRTVEDRLIQQFNLMDLYWAWKKEDAREKLESRTKVAEDRKSGIIEVTVTDGDPQRARAMAQAYVDELNRLVAEVSTSAARRERIFIEERLKVVKQELDHAAVEFSQFASKNTTIDIKEQGRAMVEAAALLQGQLIAAQTELESLKQVYTDNNVRVRAAKARIEELRRQLDKLGGKDFGTTSASQEGDSLYPSIRKLPVLGVTYADLFRRTKIAETVFELLTQQYELARVQEAKEIPTVKVLDSPVVPQKKSFPPRLWIVLLGTTVGIGAAIVQILGRARWDGIDEGDPRKSFVVEVAAGIKADLAGIRSNGNLRSMLGRFVRREKKQEHSQEEPPPV